jgi:hypothetical protein
VDAQGLAGFTLDAAQGTTVELILSAT